MAWPKGQKRVSKIEETEGTAPKEIAAFDTCRYHNDFEPRVFRKGEAIPQAWEDSPAKITSKWVHDFATGTWSKA